MATEKTLNAGVFEFLGRLITKATAPVFLIVDNHSVHRSKQVLEFVKETKGMLRLFYFPPYSPKLNQDKHIWSYLQNHNIGLLSHRDKSEFHERVSANMELLQ